MSTLKRSGWMIGLIQLILVIAIVGGALVLTRALRPDNTVSNSPLQLAERELAVRTVIPGQTTGTPIIDLNGVVEARTQTNIAPQVGGQVISVSESFKPGGFIKKGSVLFRIDPADFQLSVERAEAEIAAAQSDLTRLEAEIEVARQEWTELYPGREITKLAAREPQLAAAQARLQGAVASKRTAELSLRRSVVYAPFDGYALATVLDVGQNLAPNQSVGTVYSIENVEVSAPVSDEEMALFEGLVGRNIAILSENGQQQLTTGVVDRLDAALDARTRLATVYIRGDGLAELQVGRFVTARVSGDPRPDALTIPASSLTTRNGVWIVNDGQLESRTISIIARANGELTVAAFDYGEGVIPIPPVDVTEGMTVRLLNEEQTASATAGAANGSR